MMETSSQHPTRSITLHDAICEFLVAKQVERLSKNTLESYTIVLGQFERFMGADIQINQIAIADIRNYLGSLTKAKPKTIINTHAVLSSLWTWAIGEGVCIEHIVRKIQPPKPDQLQVKPLSRDDVMKLMAAAEADDRAMVKALLLTMIDTGVRASEVTGLRIKDLKGSTISVFGKGAKWRDVPLSRRTMQALIIYLDQRGPMSQKDPLFPSLESESGHEPMSRHGLLKLIYRLGRKAGVPDVHPHKFRHTFALNYLINGGDAISLQKLLGHTSLDMVKRYVNLANDNLQEIHQRASPVENWKL